MAAFLTWQPAMVLAAGGPDATDHEQVDIAEDLAEIARGPAPDLAYALISFEPTFGHGQAHQLAE